jgi:hypothetical protein
MPGAAPTSAAWLTRERCALAGVLVFTLAVRGGALWALRGNLAQDPDAYRQIAENLLQHGVLAMGAGDHPPPTAYRPPLYPIVLSNLPAADGRRLSLAKVAALHLLLGVATVWLTWLIACRVGQASEASAGPPSSPSEGGSPAAATLSHPTLAGLLVACDPILLNQQSLVMTETLATFLAALALWCLVRFGDCRSWFWAGLSGGAIGLAALCRPTFLPWLGLVGAAMLAVKCGMGNAECRVRTSGCDWLTAAFGRLANVIALSAVAAAVMSPWVIRNYRVFDKPIATTTHGGYTLYLANNPEFYAWLRGTDDMPWAPSVNFPGEVFSPSFANTPAQIELWTDDWLKNRAQATMRADPAGVWRAGVYRIRQLWSPLPNRLTADESTGRRLLRYATCAWYCGVFALAAAGVWRLRWRLLAPPWIWGVLLCLAFTAVHTFYWTNLRMRAPLMPLVALVAAAAVAPRGKM